MLENNLNTEDILRKEVLSKYPYKWYKPVDKLDEQIRVNNYDMNVTHDPDCPLETEEKWFCGNERLKIDFSGAIYSFLEDDFLKK